MIVKNSKINFTVGLDENRLPEEIKWEASDSGVEGTLECKSVMISIWDPKDNNTLRIDLWTKEMLVDEMKQFYHQTLISMADTFERSTGETEMAKEMRDFCKNFAEKMDLVQKDGPAQ